MWGILAAGRSRIAMEVTWILVPWMELKQNDWRTSWNWHEMSKESRIQEHSPWQAMRFNETVWNNICCDQWPAIVYSRLLFPSQLSVYVWGSEVLTLPISGAYQLASQKAHDFDFHAAFFILTSTSWCARSSLRYIAISFNLTHWPKNALKLWHVPLPSTCARDKAMNHVCPACYVGEPGEPWKLLPSMASLSCLSCIHLKFLLIFDRVVSISSSLHVGFGFELNRYASRQVISSQFHLSTWYFHICHYVFSPACFTYFLHLSVPIINFWSVLSAGGHFVAMSSV